MTITISKFKKTGISAITKDPQLLTFVVALAAVLISLSMHELWQDETEAPSRIRVYGWNLWALIQSFRGDTHLPLYHIFLYPIFNIGYRILDMDVSYLVKSLTFIQYVLLAYLSVKWIRFPYSLLFLLSYYCIYEYGTISRCYLLALIFLLIIFRKIVFKEKTGALGILACFLFPLTHLLSLVYSVPLFIYSIIRKNWIMVASFSASYPIALYFFHFRSDVSKAYEFNQKLSIGEYIGIFFKTALSAWLPFSTEQPWWNQSFALSLNAVNLFFAAISVSLIVLAITRLYKLDRLLTIACCTGGLFDLAILTIKYPLGNFRHTGYAVWPFICLLALTLSLPEHKQNPLHEVATEGRTREQDSFFKLLQYSCVFVLLFHAVAGVAAVYKDARDIFAFPAAQVRVIEEALSSMPPKSVVYDYPAGSSLAIAAVANWQYPFNSVFSLAERQCITNDNSATVASIANSSKTECPKSIIVTTWAVPLQGIVDGDLSGLSNLSNSRNERVEETLAQGFFNQPVETFLSDRSFKCEPIASLRHSQTVDEYAYKCTRELS